MPVKAGKDQGSLGGSDTALPPISRDHEALWPCLSLWVDPIPETGSVLSDLPDLAVHPQCFRDLREYGAIGSRGGICDWAAGEAGKDSAFGGQRC